MDSDFGDHKKVLKLETLSPQITNLNFIMGSIRGRSLELKRIEKPLGDGYISELAKDDRFPADLRRKADYILNMVGNRSIGCYSDHYGIEEIRHQVAKFLSRRDNVPSDYQDIFLTTGVTSAIQLVMKLLTNAPDKKKAGFMIPIPQYPVYSLTITEINAEKIPYYLDENLEWGITTEELDRAYYSSLDKCEPKAIVIINPGNPTSQILSLDNIKEIIKWAYEKNLFILADEVYQDNIYTEELKFHSFKKVAYELGYPYSKMEIASFYSASKGYVGECGARGGFVELINIDSEVKFHFRKLVSTNLCPPLFGQICLWAIINPPIPGEESYELFVKEKNEILNLLSQKATMVSEIFNQMEGIKCVAVKGSMYAFPSIELPKRAIDYAKSKNMEPDEFYCMELLEQAGIAVAVGYLFLQKSGTYHFRITILPPIEKIKKFIIKFEEFHRKFMEKWSKDN